MRTEVKEIKWYHYPEELPQCEAAEVLVRAKSKAALRMGYFTLMWFMSETNPAFRMGFVYNGNPLGKLTHDEYFPFNEFEWCYLTEDNAEDNKLISIF